MSISRKLKNASSGAADGGGGPGTYVDDVFSTYVYEGTGTFLTITNGIDLDGKGGMTWFKRRDGDSDHQVFDSERTGRYTLQTNTSDAQRDEGGVVWAPKDTGFRINGDAGSKIFNSSGDDYVSWTWRKAPKFFDVVTYTGTGAGQVQTISHSLDSTVGMLIVKSTSSAGGWYSWHRGYGDNGYMQLQSDFPKSPYTALWGDTAPTSTGFTVSEDMNTLNDGYVAYVFAHEDSDESLIKCGSYTGNETPDGPEIDLGFEPQWLLTKCNTNSGNWSLIDNIRGAVTNGDDKYLRPNTSEQELTEERIIFTPTGFKVTSYSAEVNQSDQDFIYMAIRRPNKPAEEFDPEELFAVDPMGSTGDGKPPAFRSPLPIDMAIRSDTAGASHEIASRLTAGNWMYTDQSAAESSVNDYADFDFQNGWSNSGVTSSNYISHMWRRAPGYFDVVCYEGDGVNGRALPHNLGVAPEMIWVKNRTNANNWVAWHSALDITTESLALNLDAPTGDAPNATTGWFTQAATATHIYPVNYQGINQSPHDYTAYLFATVPGISKVGSYTGNGGNQTIDCGFTNGARFVVVKKTNSTDGANGSSGGDWMFWDTVRGLTNADNDPWLSLNTNAAQGRVSGRDIDPHPSGFSVNTDYPYINDVGGEYIFYAIA